jgi:hypothetical protein
LDSGLGFFYNLHLIRLFRQADGKNFNKNELEMKTVKGFTATDGDGVWGNSDICVL